MKRLVIIGGGFCGSRIARGMQKDFDVTLIDNKNYFEFTPGILRLVVKPEKYSDLRVTHGDYMSRGRFVRGDVREVDGKKVLVGRKSIPYDYLVISSGEKYGKNMVDAVPAYTGELMTSSAGSVEKAKDILIIGGGLVGVELAAEICVKCSEKNITIVHDGTMLIERNHHKAIKYVQHFLSKYNVKIIFGEKIVRKERGFYITDKGTRILADIAFGCAGIRTSADFMKRNFANCLNDRGAIKVNEFLQVDGSNRIFAGGDVTAISEEKTAQNAEHHAEVIMENIRNLEGKKPLREYHRKRLPMLISLGKWDGILEYRDFTLTGIVPALGKMFVEWKTLAGYR